VVLPDDAEEEAVGILQRRQLANELIKDNLTKAQERMKKYADKNRKENIRARRHGLPQNPTLQAHLSQHS
jgi:hypothetical protein